MLYSKSHAFARPSKTRLWRLMPVQTAMLCLALLLLAPSVRAQSEDAPLLRHFNNGDACFGRLYSNEHRAKHPQQRTAEIRLDYYPDLLGIDGDGSGVMPYPKAREIIVLLSVRLSGNPFLWQTTAFCWPEGDKMSCGIECDGGRFDLIDRSADSLLLTGGSDLMFSDCAASDKTLRRAPDDRSFLLHRLPAEHCAP